MHKINIFLPFLFFLMLFGCMANDDQGDEQKNIKLDNKSAQLIEADNAFGLDLFQRIRATSNEENLMISPLSVSLALAMAYNGADNTTKTEMETAMKLNGLTVDQINNSYEMLVDALQSLDEEVVFEIANAIYYQEGFPIHQSFLDINQSVYKAEVESLQFGPAAVDIINAWVADKTHDKIKTIIQDLSPQARMVLLNAIYFYGTWTKEFDEDGTKMNRFTKNDGTITEIPMMSKTDELEYTANELFSAVKLPYGNGQYQMVVMRPEDGYTSTDLVKELSMEKWTEWSSQFSEPQKVQVTMPRFKFGFKSQLNNILEQMGMEQAFTSNADFSKISDEKLYISEVIHKTYIDVNETGTEAAAVTAIVFEVTSAGPGPEKIYFTVDKPFVFAITEEDTGAILFIGEVQNPEYEE
ncbi:serpin family protein [Maribellus sediminis]|uniref:serpin family protein n=1 Tax=Maribellus sediminis TaxID=2696285 RepID=UPI001431F2F9|nr:serpin family protein [Maribellus sediminis]